MANFNYLSIQNPLIMLASMLTGRDVASIIAMEVHERCALLHLAVLQLEELTLAMEEGTEPTGPGGVTLTEAELARIVDEAPDVTEAAKLIWAKSK